MLTKINILEGWTKDICSSFLLSFKRDKTEEIYLLKSTPDERKHMQSGSRN